MEQILENTVCILWDYVNICVSGRIITLVHFLFLLTVWIFFFTISVYVDSSESCNDLAFILGTSAVDTTLATRSWTIRVTQYDCSYQNLAPSGCTEYYFGDTTGTISSYNFNSGNGYNLANQNHKICIRSEGTNCKICYTTAVPDFQISGSKTSPASGTYSFLTTSCCQYTANGIINYLLIIII